MIDRYTWRTSILEVALWILALAFFGFPLYILIIVALTEPNKLSLSFDFPSHIYWGNFSTAWVDGNIPQAFMTSVCITAASTFLVVLFSATASFVIARITRWWSKWVFGLFLAGIIIPGGLGVIPLYLMFRDLGLLGTPWALIIIYVGGSMPMSVFLYSIFLRALPREYEEAALIDGCPRWRIFFSVTLPLARPITGTIVILTVIGIYNDFFTPLLYLMGSDYTTLPLALMNFSTKYYSDWGAIFAGLIIAILPVLICYLFMQKSIMRGFSGGLKG
jgi:raffinose/stachyose/melibiose transport system permease protein